MSKEEERQALIGFVSKTWCRILAQCASNGWRGLEIRGLIVVADVGTPELYVDSEWCDGVDDSAINDSIRETLQVLALKETEV